MRTSSSGMGDRRTSLVDHNALYTPALYTTLTASRRVCICFSFFFPQNEGCPPPKDFKILPMKISTQQLMFACPSLVRVSSFHLPLNSLLVDIWSRQNLKMLSFSLRILSGFNKLSANLCRNIKKEWHARKF